MRSHFISGPDGLKLHAAEFGDRTSPRLPAVCLPGLARTAADFDSLAEALASDAKSPRRVVAIDYRGRGRSAYDRDPTNYTYATELGDLEAVLTALDVGPAVFIGTSRGGILTMLLAALSPTRIAGAVLNDIGPAIEVKGLVRIKGYVGKLPQPASWSDAAGILKRMFDAQFPKLTGEDWLAAARLTWRDDDGGLTLNYDPRLARTLDAIDPEKPVPELWPQFEALAHAPLMVIRGALSDLLSEATVNEMRRRRCKIEVVDVADEGHPPRLGTPELIRRIAQFARACDEARRA
jgi:pimeloyl-ACP methyl ester carboxylesterase